MKSKLLALGLNGLFMAAICGAAEADRDMFLVKPEAIEAWKDRRFGMFICWGPVSLTGLEIGWSRGNPTPVATYDTLCTSCAGRPIPSPCRP